MVDWGKRIPIEAEPPAWLRDSDRIAWLVDETDGLASETWSKWCPISWKMVSDFGGIKLPADHPYYLATERGFTYWPGGDAAPADWDGGAVLLNDGEIYRYSGPTVDGWRGPTDKHKYAIGYRRRAETPFQPDQATIDRVVEKLRAAGQWAAVDLIVPKPVDPDVLVVRKILDAWHKGNFSGLLDGYSDDDDGFAEALAAYKAAKQ